MRTYGLIGYPLSHSFSKNYFTEKFEREGIQDAVYELFPIAAAEELSGLIMHRSSLCGLNVTIPHKVAILPLLNEIDEAARKIGAVNCIRIHRNSGKIVLKGYNTDATGFGRSLQPMLQPWHTKALVFGTGGASKAVQYVLEKLGIPFRLVSRTGGDLDYSALDKNIIEQHTLLINTTPLGMYPNIDSAPALPYAFITPEHLAYDLVYNPGTTTFLARAAEKGASIKNGLEMLRLQAEESWYIWNSGL